MNRFLTGAATSLAFTAVSCATVSENLNQLGQSLTAPSYEQLSDTSENGEAIRTEISDYDKTVRQGMLIGAAAGAVAGGAIANSKEDSDTGDVVAGAVVGGVIGGVLGGLGGKAVADRKAKQIAEEDRLDEEILAQSERNQSLERISNAAQKLVSEREAELAALGDDEVEQRQRMAQLLRDDVRNLDKAIRAAESDVESLEALKANFELAEDQAKIEEQRLIAETQIENIQLVQAEYAALQERLL